MAAVMLVITLGSVALPGLVGFVGEFLTLLGAFLSHRVYAVLATGGVILGAVYLLWAYQRMWHGPWSGTRTAASRPDRPRSGPSLARWSPPSSSSACSPGRCWNGSSPRPSNVVEQTQAPSP